MSVYEPYYTPLSGCSGADVLRDEMNTPEPGRLFGEFWREGELAVLCGADGAGKSIMALQIADSISKGKPVEGFALDTEARPVMYLDLSTPDRVFYKRYTAEGMGGHDFSPDFHRVFIYKQFYNYNRFKSEFAKSLADQVKTRKIKVLVVNCMDAIKNLAGENFIIPLVKRLQAVYGLSVLLVSGVRQGTEDKKITLGCMPNKRLAGVADSVFALGKSNKEEDLRYLIQLKSGNGKITFGEDNTAILKITKPTNFTGFELVTFEEEYGHRAEKLSELEKSILTLQYNDPDLSYAKIANMLGTNKMKVKRTLSKHRNRMKLAPSAGGEPGAEDETEFDE